MATSDENEAPRRGRGRPAILSREKILRAALELVRREGREALTMRAVAEEFGTGPMSLYTHVRGKEDLLEGIATLAVDRLEVELGPSGSWGERLGRWMHSVRAELRAHPELMQLVVKQHYGSPQLLRTCRLAAEILVEAGFERPDAAEAAQGLLWCAMGFFMLESGQGEEPSGKAPEAELAAALATMSEEERTATEPFLPHFATRDFEPLYDSLVCRLIAGLEAERA
jgi:AcrR family transcriptional regulator